LKYLLLVGFLESHGFEELEDTKLWRCNLTDMKRVDIAGEFSEEKKMEENSGKIIERRSLIDCRE
jgi:hypothetical protein